MKLTLSDDKRILLTQILIAGFVFFIPLSPTIKSVFLVASLTFILCTPYYNKHLITAFSTLWARAALLFFAFVLLACLWSPASYSIQGSAIGKYCKLLYLPVLALAFIEPRVRSLSVHSYLLVMVITCVISILKFYGYIASTEPGEVVYNYIITGFMMSLSTYLAAYYMTKAKGWPRLAYLAIVLLTSYQVFFVNRGRTGYIVYFVLISLLFMQTFSIKKALLSILGVLGLIGLIYTQSNTMQMRVHDLMSDVKYLQQDQKNTSLGYRIQFHDFARSLFNAHPIIGVGTGGYKYYFVKDNPVPSWGTGTSDPHGQYWMILSELGLVGLALFVIFLGSLLLSSLQLKESRPILLGVLTSFCLGSFSDSLFCYSTIGYLLVVFSALSFGELLQKQINQPGYQPETLLTKENPVTC